MKIGGINVEYIIYFLEIIEIGPLFPVNRKETLYQPVLVNVNSYKMKQLTSFFCCGTSYVMLF